MHSCLLLARAKSEANQIYLLSLTKQEREVTQPPGFVNCVSFFANTSHARSRTDKNGVRKKE